ncbi:MAG: RiPP maturation radical SAM C-methyltransferase [Thermodesulfobacteriota bacterium]
MSSEPAAATLRLALIAMPWPLFNRPSIQLGVLKSYLAQELPWVEVDLFHPYLDTARRLTPGVYETIARRMWLAEALFAPLAFPEMAESARRVARREGNRAGLGRQRLAAAFAAVAAQIDEFPETADWSRYDLIGFTVCFNQLAAALAAARAIKEHHPGSPVLFGGASMLPGAGAALGKTGLVDHVICGEGEQQLAALCRRLAGRDDCDDGHPPPLPPPQMPSLDRLPAPDYRDYFRELGAQFGPTPFLPTLPIEFSRGCWWGKCAFCNLNRQWQGYRQRPTAGVLEEIAAQGDRHGVLDFAFTDNVLPVREGRALFTALAGQGRGRKFFAELRPGQLRDAPIYRQGGLDRVQVGIEGMSASLLTRLGKGTTVMDNVLAMKSALANGIRLEGNLILEFPQSTEREVEETIDALDFLFPFPPLDGAAFFLGSGSPVDGDPRRYGIRALLPHPGFAALFPAGFVGEMPFPIRGYRGDRGEQHRRWRPVRKKIEQWQAYHRQRKNDAVSLPLLSFRDGGTFLLIRQELADGRILHHRLRGTSRRIYLALAAPRTVEELVAEFPAAGEGAIRVFLVELVGKRLVYTDKKNYLALAVTETGRGRA